jgi:hypothetical protein
MQVYLDGKDYFHIALRAELIFSNVVTNLRHEYIFNLVISPELFVYQTEFEAFRDWIEKYDVSSQRSNFPLNFVTL